MRVYRYNDNDQVVAKHFDLEKFNDYVFLRRYEENYGYTNFRNIEIYFRIENTYFYVAQVREEYFDDPNYTYKKQLEPFTTKESIVNYINNANFISTLYLKVAEENPTIFDYNQLLNKRNEFFINKEKEKQLEKQRKEELARQREIEREQNLIETINKFKQGAYLTGDEFIDVCEKLNVNIPPRTKGAIGKYKMKISLNDGIQYTSSKKNNLCDGVFKVLKVLENMEF